MANTRVVLAKMKELHYRMGGGHPQVLIGVIAKELSLTHEAVNAHVVSLKKLKFVDQVNHEAVTLTREGLAG